MKIGELIKRLEEIGPEVEVFVPGYEGGYRDINEAFTIVDVVLNVNTHWWLGPHERPDYVNEGTKQNYKRVKGIVL